MELDRKDLKIQALTERIAHLTAEYENKVSDLRVELTITSAERDGYQQEVEQLKSEVQVEEDNSTED
jgi:hypothetical protein